MKHISLFSLLSIFLVHAQEYTEYCLTTEQGDRIEKMILKKQSNGLWQAEVIACPRGTEDISAENNQCTTEKKEATREEVEMITQMIHLFPFLNIEFETGCPPYLKSLGKEDFNFLKNHTFFLNDNKTIYLIALERNEGTCNFIVRPASFKEKVVYAKLTQVFKEKAKFEKARELKKNQ